jgi:DNA-binding NarL/FixJ family response regulator
VLLADDDRLVRAALRALVNGLAGFQVVGEAASGREALESVERDCPDVILMDIAMPELDGLHAAAQVFAKCPRTKVIILTGHVCEETVFQAVHAGAAGFLSKAASPEELAQALRCVAQGGTYFGDVAKPDSVANGVEGARGREKLAKHLTPRQLEVLTRIAEGDSTKMIARKLGITVKTAAHHRANLMHSLDLHDTASLVRFAVRMGLVEPNS